MTETRKSLACDFYKRFQDTKRFLVYLITFVQNLGSSRTKFKRLYSERYIGGGIQGIGKTRRQGSRLLTRSYTLNVSMSLLISFTYVTVGEILTLKNTIKIVFQSDLNRHILLYLNSTVASCESDS